MYTATLSCKEQVSISIYYRYLSTSNVVTDTTEKGTQIKGKSNNVLYLPILATSFVSTIIIER